MSTPAHDTMRRGYFYAAIVVCIWTGFILVSRMGGKSDLTPYDVIALRYAVAGIAILPFWYHHRTNLLDWRKLALAMTGAIGFTLFAFNGFRHAPASHAGILLQGFLPFSVAVMAYFIAQERPTRQRLLGLAFIAAGVGSMATESFHGGLTLLGDSLLIGASLCWAVYTVLLRRWNIPPMDSAIAVTLIATILYLPIYLLFLPQNVLDAPWQQSALQAVYQGTFVAVVQMIFYTRAVAALGASRLAIITSCVPVLATLGAVPLLHEPITHATAIGLTLVVIGALTANFHRRRPIPPAE